MQRNKDIDRRSRRLAHGNRGSGPVVYWMSRDQRAADNWALLFARQEAIARQVPLCVVFCLSFDYPGANIRHYGFMLRGLAEVQRELRGLGIGFVLAEGAPERRLPGLVRDLDCHFLVTDFDPLRIKRQWQQTVVAQVDCPCFEVDAHNVIPAWEVSDKKEYGAYTIRPKIKRLIDDYLTDFPPLEPHPHPFSDDDVQLEVDELLQRVNDKSVSEVDWLQPGPAAAAETLKQAIAERLPHYSEQRNDPGAQAQSGLSPYLHFGQLAPQRAAWEVSRADLSRQNRDDFIEELVVRRELSDNYCYYEPDYDTAGGFPDWGRKTLADHRRDRRDYVYDLEELEQARTHEPLWNACQADLVQTGKLHGYLRMYWAKKILEWTEDPDQAQEFAIILNDRYSLDGRDPNGYTGIAWSIGGVHDRAWKERPVFGKIRYMNENGCRRKFDVQAYVDAVSGKR